MFISILIFIAIALPSINKHMPSILYVRIISLLLIYVGALIFNAFYIQSIGSGIGIYSGLFQVTLISQLFDIFIGSLILVAWPIMSNKSLQHSVDSIDVNSSKLGQNVISINNYPTEYSLIALMSILGATLFFLSYSHLYINYWIIKFQFFGISANIRYSYLSSSKYSIVKYCINLNLLKYKFFYKLKNHLLNSTTLLSSILNIKWILH